MEQEAQDSALALRNSISHLAFLLTPSPSPLRRSSRNLVSVKTEVKEEQPELSPSRALASLKKRKKESEDSDEGTPKKKARPVKRGYADPATYAHLKSLSDYLAVNLDVIFCGINPGCMSATKGHHFANPTNHFWKGLHLSGFTPRLLSPSEDSTLPALYNIGLTNLVERPSSEQAELSKSEMRDSVPSLKAKFLQYRPHVVCFVGKGMWLIVETAFKEQIRTEHSSSTTDDPLTPSLIPGKSSPARQAKGKGKTSIKPFSWGLQPYKLVYPSPEAVVKKEESMDEDSPFSLSAASIPGASSIRETLFFVMPSTSGRVVSHQLADKVKLFARLRSDLETLKSNKLDTRTMVTVPLV